MSRRDVVLTAKGADGGRQEMRADIAASKVLKQAKLPAQRDIPVPDLRRGSASATDRLPFTAN